MYLSSFYQQKTIKNFQNVLTKDLKDVYIVMNKKQKLETKKKKKTANEYRYFLKSKFLRVN